MGLGFVSCGAFAGGQKSRRIIPDFINGVTLDSTKSIADSIDSIASLKTPMMTRVVFDEWVPANFYLDPVTRLYEKSFIMGEILDSSAVKQYTVTQYRARTVEYLKALGTKVDLWEVGNEINGEWLGKTSVVVAKMTSAYDEVKKAGLKAALTLYYNPECWAKPSHEMFLWAQQNIPPRMKQGLDYVWVSYYEDDCNGYQPDWFQVMNQIASLFPNSKIGIGECGTTDLLQKEAFVKKYYSLRPAVPRFVGGFFWWYFKTDMVPKTLPLWSVLNTIVNQ
ncbi:hypothetical protein EBT16_02055 [bacterium]|nr:hypothetical protein [bacterium]